MSKSSMATTVYILEHILLYIFLSILHFCTTFGKKNKLILCILFSKLIFPSTVNCGHFSISTNSDDLHYFKYLQRISLYCHNLLNHFVILGYFRHFQISLQQMFLNVYNEYILHILICTILILIIFCPCLERFLSISSDIMASTLQSI